MVWLALFVPFVACLILFKFFGRQIAWWEPVIPFVATALVIVITKAIAVSSLESDIKYKSSVIVSARYYEYWETWVKKTCSSTHKVGKTTYTTYYDCSYCAKHEPEWYAYDAIGNSYVISESYYNQLKILWVSQLKFVELNRNIKYHSSVFGKESGKDGDAYDIVWNKQIDQSITASWSVGYTNIIQASRSAFKLKPIDDPLAVKYGLFKYPEITGYYNQSVVMGYRGLDSNLVKRRFEYFNGYYSPRKDVKLFLIFFYDKPQDIAIKQEHYWLRGNENELVVCIGLSGDGKKMDWVYSFGWSDEKRNFVDTREDLMEIQNYYSPVQFYTPLANIVDKYWKPKDFNDFNYLSVDLPKFVIKLIFIFSLVVTIATSWWCVINDFERTGKVRKNYY